MLALVRKASSAAVCSQVALRLVFLPCIISALELTTPIMSPSPGQVRHQIFNGNIGEKRCYETPKRRPGTVRRDGAAHGPLLPSCVCVCQPASIQEWTIAVDTLAKKGNQLSSEFQIEIGSRDICFTPGLIYLHIPLHGSVGEVRCTKPP